MEGTVNIRQARPRKIFRSIYGVEGEWVSFIACKFAPCVYFGRAPPVVELDAHAGVIGDRLADESLARACCRRGR